MAKDEFASVLATYTAAKAEYNRLRQAEARATARGVPSRGVPAVSSRGSGSVEGLRRLLLISRRGPACFVVADELHPLQTVTVTISTRHVCTGCRSASCAHIRWVLSRCLHLDVSSASASGLSEAALSRALEAAAIAQPIGIRRRSTPTRVLHTDSVSWLQRLSDEDAWLLSQPTLTTDESSERHPVTAGDTCAICMEEMDDAATAANETLIWCRASSPHQCCGRALHRQCLLTWGRHQPDGVLTCPMCRAPWDKQDACLAADWADVGATRERQLALRRGLDQIALREGLGEVARRRRAAESERAAAEVEVAAAAMPTVAAATVTPAHLPAARSLLVPRLPAGTAATCAGRGTGLQSMAMPTVAGCSLPPASLACTSLPPRRSTVPPLARRLAPNKSLPRPNQA